MLETFSVIKDGPQIGKYPVIEEDRKLLINKEKKKIILKDFQAMALSSLREAEIQKLSNKTNIPIWYYLLLIVLGFDKFLWFANNSYLLIFLIIGGFLWVNYGDSNIANLRFLAKDRLMSIFGSGNNETIK
ncbi:Dynamin-like GTPase that mediates homotypic ER fusion [Bonamia ostreae]|uniref:Dynamin-like GTPase that mediates homotypic ER fusion n=1 Tax=Bonamia ostreae TaxID=126728 RepID=A0ABV2ATY3_9EUKA